VNIGIGEVGSRVEEQVTQIDRPPSPLQRGGTGALALALAACSGRRAGDDLPPADLALVTPDAALTAFVSAAIDGDAEGMWETLSLRSRRLGPTLEAFEERAVRDLERSLGSFGRD